MRAPAKKSIAAISLLVLLAGGVVATGAAQDSAQKTASTPAPQPHPYRLDYTLTELQDGKKVNSRQYSINIGGGSQNGRPWVGRVQIGTRVPAGAKTDGTVQSVEVGTSINGSVTNRDGIQVVDTNCDMTS